MANQELRGKRRNHQPHANRVRRLHAVGNAAEGIPRGNIRGGRDPLAGGTRTEMQHYTAHVTWHRRLAAPVTARSGMSGGAERRSWRDLLARAGGRIITFELRQLVFKVLRCIKKWSI
jgi:hypothetical protein